MTDPPDTEFAFELRVCGWAERNWPPEGSRDDDTALVVARQLGTKRRRWDTIVVEADRDALDRRAAFGDQRLDSDLLHVVRHAPATWTWYRDALPDPGYPWRYVREAVHRAADRDLVETRQDDAGRIELRRRWRYPDWAERIIAIENKPDLDASAARALAEQVERDVAMGLADEVWIATRATGDRVEPILLEETPVQAGVLTFDFERESPASVEWLPRSLAVEQPGVRLLDRPDGGEYDHSAAEFEYVPADEKAAKRREIVERAYERGWRSYVESMRPDCRHFDLRCADGALLPYCHAKRREPSATECSERCANCTPEPPAWRQKGWPIEGGPGKAVQRLLADRRARRR
jgi:hypothetical protein